MEFNKINSLVELFFKKYKEKKELKNQPFLKWLKANKNNFLTWEQVKHNICLLSEYLKGNLSKGDRCVLLSENRPEWLIADIAIMNAGGVTVPLFTTYSEKDYEHIINDCKPKICIVSNENQFKKIEKFVSNETKIISFENFNQKIESIKNILEKNPNQGTIDILDNYNKEIIRKDLACIIYTSGTTGNPKGVMLSHGGILSNCEGARKILESLTKDDHPIFLTWLPLSHSYEHTVQYVQISLGAKVYYAESLEKLLPNMTVAQPTIMTAVPRFYQNLYQKINSNFKKTTGIKKAMIEKMINLGLKKIQKKPLGFIEKIIDTILDKIVRKKIKKQFGGSLKTFVSGGGALDKEVGLFLNAIGLPTLQGYGLTETSPVVSCNPINDIRIETVGLPFKGNEVKIAEDGEILVKGENVMLGYWNNQIETDKVLKNGWLYTGDIGIFDKDYLKITDRKKDILITPGGDNISPLKIENEIVHSELIEQAIVYGDNKPFLVSLLVLNKDKKNVTNDIIEQEIEKINKNLSKIEKIKKFFIINDQFTIENGLMTPTLKLKRYKIIKKYKNELEKLY